MVKWTFRWGNVTLSMYTHVVRAKFCFVVVNTCICFKIWNSSLYHKYMVIWYAQQSCRSSRRWTRRSIKVYHIYIHAYLIICCLHILLYHVKFYLVRVHIWGTRWRIWLRHCATTRKGSIPDGVTGIFHWHCPSGRTMALGSTQALTVMSTRSIS